MPRWQIMTAAGVGVPDPVPVQLPAEPITLPVRTYDRGYDLRYVTVVAGGA
jgi:hypothetical protein